MTLSRFNSFGSPRYLRGTRAEEVLQEIPQGSTEGEKPSLLAQEPTDHANCVLEQPSVALSFVAAQPASGHLLYVQQAQPQQGTASRCFSNVALRHWTTGRVPGDEDQRNGSLLKGSLGALGE